ncbi:ABC transporter permease [Spirillospora sp. CA-255316]
MTAALWAEAVKFLRSKAPWVTALAFLLPVLLSVVFVSASGAASLGDKSRALGITPDWSGFRTALMQIDAAGGFLLFGIFVTWMFGREFSDRTVLDLLALPTSRAAVVLAKFSISTAWLSILIVVQTVVWLAAGALLDLPGPPGAALDGLAALLSLLALTVLLTLPVAFAASVGRGYLPGIGATVIFLVSGVAAAAIGGAGWFPWSVPATIGGLADSSSLAPNGLILVVLTGVAGVVSTVAWWQRADHT